MHLKFLLGPGIYENLKLNLNSSNWLKNGQLANKTVLDSQKDEKRHFGRNFFKM